jgi:hypothetical protein
MFRALAASFALFLWMSTLVAPWIAELGEDMMCLTELEHSEQEAEGEELSMEWDETTFEDKVTSKLDAEQWHIAHLVNVRLHERLDASRLLDPPDQHHL